MVERTDRLSVLNTILMVAAGNEAYLVHDLQGKVHDQREKQRDHQEITQLSQCEIESRYQKPEGNGYRQNEFPEPFIVGT